MDIKNLQRLYTSAFYSLRRNGFKNKLLLIFLSFPAVIYAYYDISERYKHYNWDYPHEYLYYICAILLVILIVTILTINTISFINSQRLRGFRNLFKKDLFECIQQQIPEIKSYCYYKKIHPKYFYDSEFYSSAHTDYIGDDLFRGEYKGSLFEICELHVFKLFNQVFDGLFIRIILGPLKNRPGDHETCIIKAVGAFEERYNIKVRILNKNEINIAIRLHGKLFEQNNIREISELEDDIQILSDTVKLTKDIINCTQTQSK